MVSLLRNKNIKLIINYVLGPLVFVLLSLSIYRQILEQPGWRTSLQHLTDIQHNPSSWLLIPVFALVFVNWGIEARKWQLVTRPLQHIRFGKAFKAIFSGTALASFTPNRTGEYVGRILYIEEGKRIQGIAVSILSSMAQLQVTLYAGALALLTISKGFPGFMKEQNETFSAGWSLLLAFVMVAAVLLTVFYFRIGWLLRWAHSGKKLAKLAPFLAAAEKIDATILTRILSLSIARYLVFFLQYYLVFVVFGVQVDLLQCLQVVSVMFLLLAVIPSFTFLTDLGIRWKAGIEIVSIYSGNTLGIFASAFTIWLFNLIIPALIGSLLILGIRIFKNKEA